MPGDGIMEYEDTKVWYKNNEFHRLDGPAVEYSDGGKYWYIDGKRYSEKDFETKIDQMGIPRDLFTI